MSFLFGNNIKKLLLGIFYFVVVFFNSNIFAAQYNNKTAGLAGLLNGINQGIQTNRANQLAQQRLLLAQQQQQYQEQAQYEQERPQMNVQSELDSEYIRVRQQRADDLSNALASIFKAHEELIIGIRKYTSGIIELKPIVAGDVLVFCDVRSGLYQAVEYFKQGSLTAGQIKEFEGKTAEVKRHFENAFRNLSSAGQDEIDGFKSGAMFWKANEHFDVAKAKKIIGLENAIQALSEMIVLVSAESPENLRENTDKITNEVKVEIQAFQALHNYYQKTSKKIPSVPSKQDL